ncbi:aspartate ammonia-lyase (plasmid) [Nitrobacteraceae bacterium UC4446_H13]
MSESSSGNRIEHDSLGEVAVPEHAYFGAQTARAIVNFPISGIPIRQFPEFIRALAIVKKAAALANEALGDLPSEKTAAIIAACDDIVDGKLDMEFPIDVFQGGAGTSTNMNVNEVIANRALEILKYPRGRYDIVHPNNDVNLSQSTNDVYPTAIRLAILFHQDALQDALKVLADAMAERADAFADIVKLGRTQLQDAVPMTLGQEFLAYAITLREDIERLSEISGLFREVNLGGTAIGTGINADSKYQTRVIEELRRLTGLDLIPASNLIEACWDTGAFVLFSGMLKRTATKLSKIANDLRLLSSGPRGGFGEINLPPVQPGSSIMPGKVNPVVPEVVNQVAYQIIGVDLTITMAAEAGQLQLNVMEPVIVYNLLQSMTLLRNAINVLATRCIAGITANPDQCLKHLEASTAVATALTPVIGYDRAADIAKEMLSSGRSIRDILESTPGLSAELILQTCEFLSLTRPLRTHAPKPPSLMNG